MGSALRHPSSLIARMIPGEVLRDDGLVGEVK
jgi:hypothetical protein